MPEVSAWRERRQGSGTAAQVTAIGRRLWRALWISTRESMPLLLSSRKGGGKNFCHHSYSTTEQAAAWPRQSDPRVTRPGGSLLSCFSPRPSGRPQPVFSPHPATLTTQKGWPHPACSWKVNRAKEGPHCVPANRPLAPQPWDTNATSQ